MDNVKCIGTEFYSGYNDGSDGNVLFPVLETLKLIDMPSLVEWKDAVEPTTTRVVFPCLEALRISKCPNLTTAPFHFPSLMSLVVSKISSTGTALESISRNLSTLTSLDIEGINSLPEQLLQNNRSLVHLKIMYCPKLRSYPSIEDLTSLRELGISSGDELLSAELQSCTSLQYLSINGCPNLISIPDLRELRSLSYLEITNCGKLTCLPNGLDCLTGLKTLQIGGLWEELNVFPSFNSIQHLQASLQCLSLYGWHKLMSLPDEIQHFTALTQMFIFRFDGMEALPEWLGNLSSLRLLQIFNCKNLKYLPTMEAMRRLTNLKHFTIDSCPKLKERCDEGSRAEWSKIAHFPNIRIDGKWVKEEAIDYY